LQELVPGAVLVGGTVAALYVNHRSTLDHDHVLADLADRFDAVLGVLRAEPTFAEARTVPGKLILGSLDGIEVGVRQQRRAKPLETHQLDLPSGRTLTVPRPAEALRIKAFLVTDRNRAKDYLDVAALADHAGLATAAKVLDGLDRFYPPPDPPDPFQLLSVRLPVMLATPDPVDGQPRSQWASDRHVSAPWDDWASVVGTCGELAVAVRDYRRSRLALNSAADLAEWLHEELAVVPPDVGFMLRVIVHETDRWLKNEETAAEMPELVAEVPPLTGSERWDAFLEGVVAFRMWEMSLPEPEWCDRTWLDELWNPYGETKLRITPKHDVAMAWETPPQILARGVIYSYRDMQMM